MISTGPQYAHLCPTRIVAVTLGPFEGMRLRFFPAEKFVRRLKYCVTVVERFITSWFSVNSLNYYMNGNHCDLSDVEEGEEAGYVELLIVRSQDVFSAGGRVRTCSDGTLQ